MLGCVNTSPDRLIGKKPMLQSLHYLLGSGKATENHEYNLKVCAKENLDKLYKPRLLLLDWVKFLVQGKRYKDQWWCSSALLLNGK